jgi:hypothetical protein
MVWGDMFHTRCRDYFQQRRHDADGGRAAMYELFRDAAALQAEDEVERQQRAGVLRRIPAVQHVLRATTADGAASSAPAVLLAASAPAADGATFGTPDDASAAPLVGPLPRMRADESDDELCLEANDDDADADDDELLLEHNEADEAGDEADGLLLESNDNEAPDLEDADELCLEPNS